MLFKTVSAYADTNGASLKEKRGERSRLTALLSAPRAGKAFPEFISKIRYKIKSKDSGVEVSSK